MDKDRHIYAVGDIHGRSDLLVALLNKIKLDASTCEGGEVDIVFVGDYVDRGPDSCGVVEVLRNEIPSGFVAHFLKGNHEALLLDFLEDAGRLDHWRMNGGEATMRSYGVDVDEFANAQVEPEVWRDSFATQLPQAHLDFFRSLDLRFCSGAYMFVHAGVRPGVPMDAQAEQDLIWIREPFLSSDKPFGKVVVHGHTPSEEPVVRYNRIGIDTGAVFTDRLTALRLQNGDLGFLQT